MEQPDGFNPASVTPEGAAHRYGRTGPLTVVKIPVGGRLENNAYLVVDEGAGEAVLVDAAHDPDRILAEVGRWRLVGVMTTHGHQDHVGALVAVVEATGAWHAAHPADAARIPAAVTRPVAHGDRLRVGGHEVEIVHLPGHTPGSVGVVLAHGQILTGDALFPGGVGATGDERAFASALAAVETHVLSRPPETRISPGHGDDTLVGRELPQVPAWRARGW